MDEGLSSKAAEALFARVSNWGRWGDDDELGTLNHISPTCVVAATRLVRSGRVVSAAFDLDTVQSPKNYNPTVHMMLYKRHEGAVTAVDQITIVPHSFTVTHLDAVSHANYHGATYNGRVAKEIITVDGISFGSIHAQRNGIVTRGVLLDVPAARGVPWLEAGYGVTVADLEAAERHAGVSVGRGDALLVRVGLAPREGAEGPEDVTLRAGLVPECIEWLHEREISMFGGDCFEQLSPTQLASDCPWPLHQIGLAAMGLVLLDNVEVESVVHAAAAEGRNEFMFVAAPLRLPKGTGSPVNPLCLF